MATVVLVHGIAQEQFAADVLERDWLPALAGGVRTSGNPQLADRIRDREIDVRMAYYGDIFLDDGAQGGAPDVDNTADQFDDTQLDLIEKLAEQWLQAATVAADHPSDRRQAHKELAAIAKKSDGAQGPRAMLRPALNGLTQIRWFAPFGMAVAGTFVWRALTQVTSYLTDDEIRGYAQDKVLEHIGADTRLVIGHSLGSVVAYEALHRTDHKLALLTIGSPLGLKSVVYDRLRPHPPHVPASVTRWDNLVDRDDLVAARLDLGPLFPPAPGSTVRPVTPTPVDNGAKPHEGGHYLTKVQTGHIVNDVLQT